MPGIADIVQIAGSAEHLVGQIYARRRLACDPSGARVLHRHVIRRVTVEQLLVGFCPIGADLAFRSDEGPVDDVDRLAGDAGPLRHDGQHDRPRRGTCITQCAAAVRHRPAAGGDTFVRTHIGRGRLHLDPRERHVEFIRGDLGQRGEDALADFDLARADRDPAISMELDPLRQASVAVQTTRQRQPIGQHARHAIPIDGIVARFRGRREHGAHDAIMRAAAAQIAVQRRPHFGCIWVRFGGQQGCCGNEHAG